MLQTLRLILPLSLFTTLILISLGTFSVFAQETSSTTNTTTEETTNESSEENASSTEEVVTEEVTASTTTSENTPSEATTTETPVASGTSTELSPAGQDRVRNLAANISNRIDATHDRFRSIADRLEPHTTDNTLEAEVQNRFMTQWNEIDALINNTHDDMLDIDEAIEAMVTNSDPQTAWTTVRQTYLSAHSKLPIIKQKMQTLVNDIRSQTN